MCKFRTLCTLVIACLLNLILSGCSTDDSRWITTKEGVKFYLAESPSWFSMDDYSWSGDTLDGGFAHGNGILKNIDKNSVVEKGYALYGAIAVNGNDSKFTIGSLDDNKLTGLGVKYDNGTAIIGKFDDGYAKGEGRIFHDGILHYKGELKKSKQHGEGIEYYPFGRIMYKGEFSKGLRDGRGVEYHINGNKKYEGKFDAGHYDGWGGLIYHPGDSLERNLDFTPTNLSFVYGISIPDSLRLLSYDWWKAAEIQLGTDYEIIEWHNYNDGKIEDNLIPYYTRLNKHIKEYSKQQYIEIYDRIVRLEHYYIWMYIGIAFIILIVLFANFCVFTEEDMVGYDGTLFENGALYCRAKKWNWGITYLMWLFVGWTGTHRAYLKSRTWFVYGLLSSSLIAINVREICIYLFWPSSWKLWELTDLTVYVLIGIALFLVFDLFWIPWRIYCLNFQYFRHDLREQQLTSACNSSDVTLLCKDVKPVMTTTISRLKTLMDKAQSIQNSKYEGQTKLGFKRIFDATIGDDEWAQFEQARLDKLQRTLSQITEAQKDFSKLAEFIEPYLKEARANAYRNLYLAKELISTVKKAKSQKQILVVDRTINTEIADFNLSEFTLPDIQLGIDVDAAITNGMKTTSSLMAIGLRGPWALGLGLGLSVLNGIADAVQKANKMCELANENSAKIVKSLDETTKKLVDTQFDILRVSEIIMSLYEANTAFMKAYIPLRDKIYGEEYSFSYFIRGGNRVPKEDLLRDFKHLINVCSEYDKINKSKL